MQAKPQETVNLDTFTEEIVNGQLDFPRTGTLSSTEEIVLKVSYTCIVRPLPMTEHRAPFIEKFLSKVSKDSCLICFSKFILIISHNLVLIFLIMTSLVSYFFWYFSKFLAFHISFSIVIWIVRRSSLTLLSLTIKHLKWGRSLWKSFSLHC